MEGARCLIWKVRVAGAWQVRLALEEKLNELDQNVTRAEEQLVATRGDERSRANVEKRLHYQKVYRSKLQVYISPYISPHQELTGLHPISFTHIPPLSLSPSSSSSHPHPL